MTLLAKGSTAIFFTRRGKNISFSYFESDKMMPSGLLQRVGPCPNGQKCARCPSLYISLSASDSALGQYVKQKTLAIHFMSSDLKWKGSRGNQCGCFKASPGAWCDHEHMSNRMGSFMGGRREGQSDFLGKGGSFIRDIHSHRPRQQHGRILQAWSWHCTTW